MFTLQLWMWLFFPCSFKLASWKHSRSLFSFFSQFYFCFCFSGLTIPIWPAEEKKNHQDSSPTLHESDSPRLAPLLMRWLTPDKHAARRCWGKTSARASLLFLQLPCFEGRAGGYWGGQSACQLAAGAKADTDRCQALANKKNPVLMTNAIRTGCQ